MSIIIIIFICQKLGPFGPVQQKIKLPSPNMKIAVIPATTIAFLPRENDFFIFHAAATVLQCFRAILN